MWIDVNWQMQCLQLITHKQCFGLENWLGPKLAKQNQITMPSLPNVTTGMHQVSNLLTPISFVEVISLYLFTYFFTWHEDMRNYNSLYQIKHIVFVYYFN